MVAEGDSTLGGEHTMPHTDDGFPNHTVEAYIILLTPVTSIDLIKNKVEQESTMCVCVCIQFEIMEYDYSKAFSLIAAFLNPLQNENYNIII